MEAFEVQMRRGGGRAIEEASRFFMKEGPVHEALRRVTRKLEEHKVSYAVAGGMALVAHGYDRTTVDVDVLVTKEGLAEVHRRLAGLGYVPPFAGATSLRDASTGVRIEFLVTGQFPGDGKPKPVAFPDPAMAAEERDGIRYLRLPALIELKLASGMTNPGRLKDLADVQELIRVLDLEASFGEKLHPYVREKFEELRRGVQADPGPKP